MALLAPHQMRFTAWVLIPSECQWGYIKVTKSTRSRTNIIITTDPNSSSRTRRIRIFRDNGRLQRLVQVFERPVPSGLEDVATPESQALWEAPFCQVVSEAGHDGLRRILGDAVEFLEPGHVNRHRRRRFGTHFTHFDRA